MCGSGLTADRRAGVGHGSVSLLEKVGMVGAFDGAMV